MSKVRVAVLYGGASAEREVSLWTGEQVLDALSPERYEAFPVDTLYLRELLAGKAPENGRTRLPNPDLPLFSGVNRPDVCFLALHGRYGEDGAIQGMLELLGIPYTGSGVLASALAMDKSMTKRIYAQCGIPTPAAISTSGQEEAAEAVRSIAAGTAAVSLPVVVKPDDQGSTIGVTRVWDAEELAGAVQVALGYGMSVLFEAMIEGMEITAPVIGADPVEALPLVEIVPPEGFFDFEAKYSGKTEEVVPARLSAELTERAQALAVQAHLALGCSGYSRTDMMIADDGVWVLETNTLPGLTASSLLPRSAAAAGMEFPALLDRILELALPSSISPPLAKEACHA